MRIGVRLPQYGGTWEQIRASAERAEALGFDGVWVNDHLQSPGRLKNEPTFEALTTLAAVATCTARVRLGVMVLSASYRPAPLAAKMTAVVDAIAGGGRMVVGLGTGSDVEEHRAYGVPFLEPRERSARLREAIRVFRAMADHPDGATVEGHIDNAPNQPATRSRLWVAAHRPGLLRMAGRHADGVVGAFLDPATLAARHEIARAVRPAHLPPLEICLYTFVLPVTDDTPRWLRGEADALGTTPQRLMRWMSTTGLVAPPDELRDHLRAFADIGTTDAVLALPSRAPLDLLDAVAEATGVG